MFLNLKQGFSPPGLQEEAMCEVNGPFFLPREGLPDGLGLAVWLKDGVKLKFKLVGKQ